MLQRKRAKICQNRALNGGAKLGEVLKYKSGVKEEKMIYSFTAESINSGNKVFLNIPFNIWEKCGQKDNIPVRVTLQEKSFECKLIPKGGGNYVIPVAKSFLAEAGKIDGTEVKFEIIEGLSRITEKSPYSKDNPIRKINNVELILQPKAGVCEQACIAMLAGISVEEVIKVMSSGAWQASLSKLTETLDYYGIRHADKFIYTKGKTVILPRCCVLQVRLNGGGHLIVYFDGRFYEPLGEVLDSYDYERIINYLEIFTN